MTLHWEGQTWVQSCEHFVEGQKQIIYDTQSADGGNQNGDIDWVKIGLEYASGHQPDWRRFVPGWDKVA